MTAAVALTLPYREAPHREAPPPDAAPPALLSAVPGSGSGLAALRTQLEAVVAGGRTAGNPWATGIGALDVALGGGIPRGRITEVVGTLGVGKTALLRRVVTRVLRTGGWVAWIDARRTLAAAPWARLGERLVMVRPRDGKRSAWCADLLLRSGVFALVVIDGAPALSRVHGVRLAQLARERDAACVVLHDDTRPTRISGAVRLRLDPVPIRRRRDERRAFSVIVEKGGVSRSVQSIEVGSGIVMARRVCTDSEIPDRRGVARGTRRPWAAIGGNADSTVGHPITWGGLGVSAHDDIHAPAPTHRDATRAGVRGADRGRDPDEQQYRPALTPHEREHERARFNREFDKHTRDWTRYRGRRRAAESSFGKPSRRERARETVGATIGPHGGQGGPRHGAPRLGRDTKVDTPPHTRYAGTAPALGRVTEGARR